MARRKPDTRNALAWIGIAASYALLAAFVVTPIAQPCGDQATLWLRLAMTAALFGLLVFVAVVGRKKAFWLAPQVILLGILLLTLPQNIALLTGAQTLCFMGGF